MNKATFWFLIITVALLSNSGFGAIPSSERAALIALYNSTNGDGWNNNIGWKTPPWGADGFAAPGTEGSWNGVTVSEDHVTRIGLGENLLIGNIPSKLGNLGYLEWLYLGNDNSKITHLWNRLSGPIPSELGNLSHLQYLFLSRNQLTGAIPSELGNLSHLLRLIIISNRLSGAIPPQLGNLSNLEMLVLDYNQLSGAIPPELGNLSNLQYLNLSNNQLSGPIPPELGNLSHLNELSLRNSQLCGPIPPELGNLSALQKSNLGNNQLSGPIPSELGNLGNLQWLDLYNNQLSGPIPPELGNLSHLKILTIDNNQLSGPIPSQMGNLSNLEFLSLSINQLSGAIPSELGNLSHLTNLFLNNNQLSGAIPPGLGNLGNLGWLYLNNNKLCGSIPSELGNLSKIIYLYLENNRLSGPIPLSFLDLKNIYKFDISNNCLSASDPALRNWLDSHDPDWETAQCIKKEPPFGEFATPIDGSTVNSSIAVTGWALDDFGMESVKIYREQNSALIYIGDAIFIEGARPDVEIVYPGYPGNNKAGWGYMLLTYLLPNGGNGTYTLVAKATDIEGNEATLGTKTITIDNAHAVKPFGAIDTPAQGGIASGKNYVNFGWALTPQPNTIPIDGSTINVVIDGALKGHPGYNIFRSDVATLFPGYTNTNGALGYYYIDTTKLTNGVHTIAWTVADNEGNTDGIGSRYFTVMNAPTSDESTLSQLQRVAPADLTPEEGDVNRVEIKELERVEVNIFSLTLNTNTNTKEIAGYLIVGDQLRELPIGSFLDTKSGVFYWQPGPGFVGEYRFVFTGKEENRRYTKKNIVINIKPGN